MLLCKHCITKHSSFLTVIGVLTLMRHFADGKRKIGKKCYTISLSSRFLMAIRADLLRASICEEVTADFAANKSRRKMKGNFLLCFSLQWIETHAVLA